MMERPPFPEPPPHLLETICTRITIDEHRAAHRRLVASSALAIADGIVNGDQRFRDQYRDHIATNGLRATLRDMFGIEIVEAGGT